jgi:hypothetical protein
MRSPTRVTERTRHSRALLLGLIMLAALVAALTAAIVTAAAGVGLPGVLAASGVTLASAMTMGLATCQFLDL